MLCSIFKTIVATATVYVTYVVTLRVATTVTVGVIGKLWVQKLLNVSS